MWWYTLAYFSYLQEIKQKLLIKCQVDSISGKYVTREKNIVTSTSKQNGGTGMSLLDFAVQCHKW